MTSFWNFPRTFNELGRVKLLSNDIFLELHGDERGNATLLSKTAEE